ncbi:hypothetical protein FKM82_004725 [Ascaphus truei]
MKTKGREEMFYKNALFCVSVQEKITRIRRRGEGSGYQNGHRCSRDNASGACYVKHQILVNRGEAALGRSKISSRLRPNMLKIFFH